MKKPDTHIIIAMFATLASMLTIITMVLMRIFG
jgi:hypothetical protein